MSDVDGVVFGDADPEDAYHPDDTIAERLRNIDRRLRWFEANVLLDDELADRMARARDDLRTIGRQVIAVALLVSGVLDVDRWPTLPPVVFPPRGDALEDGP